MTLEKRRKLRKQTFDQMELRLKEWCPEKKVLSHALFWVLSSTLKGKIR